MKAKTLQVPETIILELGLPSSIQKINLFVDAALRNTLKIGHANFFKKYPNLKNANIFSMPDIKISTLKKFPYAEVLEDEARKQNSSGLNISNHDYLINLMKYDGEISIEVQGGRYQIPFSCVIGDTMQHYLSNQHKADTGNPIDKSGFVYHVTLGAKLENFIFEKSLEQKKSNNIIKTIDRKVIELIWEHFDFSKIFFKSAYRREAIEIHNLSSIKETQRKEEEERTMLIEKHKLPLRVLYRKDSTKIVKGLNSQGSYSEFFQNGKIFFRENVEKLRPVIGDRKNFIDLGCLEGEEVIYALRKLNIEGGEYMGTDISIADLLKLGQTRANINSDTAFNFNLHVLDIEDIDILKNKNNKTIFMIGGIFGNLDKKERNIFISKIAQVLKKGESLVLGVFLHDEGMGGEEITGLYDKPQNEEFILNGFRNAGVESKSIEHHVEYNEQDRTVYIYGICKNNLYDVDGKITSCKEEGQNNNIPVLTKSTRILAAISKRFTIEEIQELEKESDLKFGIIAAENGQGLFSFTKQ